MSHKGKVTLKCDIEQNNKIIFENVEVYFWADLFITLGRFEGDFEVEEWESEDAVSDDIRPDYSYSIIMNEFGAPKEFEDYMQDLPYSDFTLLVKSEEFSEIEIDYEMFEPDYDLMREGK